MNNQFKTGELIVSSNTYEFLIKLSKNKKFPNITEYLSISFYKRRLMLLSITSYYKGV